MDYDEKNDLAITGIGTVAKLFGVVNPVAATMGIVTDCIKERRSKKFSKRLENLILSLEKRIERLEDQPQVEPNLDLLDEIVAKAISEEDEDKTEYYAALIQYYSVHPLEPYEVRILGNALKSLTTFEIESFVYFVKAQSWRKSIPDSLKDVFWIRVEYLGLFKGGNVKHPTQATQLGKKLVEIYDLAFS